MPFSHALLSAHSPLFSLVRLINLYFSFYFSWLPIQWVSFPSFIHVQITVNMQRWINIEPTLKNPIAQWSSVEMQIDRNGHTEQEVYGTVLWGLRWGKQNYSVYICILLASFLAKIKTPQTTGWFNAVFQLCLKHYIFKFVTNINHN